MNRLEVATLILSLAGGAPAWAHVRLVDPVPRTPDSGLKTAPCGGKAPTTSPTPFEAGQRVLVRWEETIHHPGWYRIAFSPSGDQGFDDHILADNIPDQPGTGFYEYTVTLPDAACTGCTLQLIQVMTDKPQQNGDYQKYYSCADLTLEAGAATVLPFGTPTPEVPTPTPEAPAPTPADATPPPEGEVSPTPQPEEPTPTRAPDPTPGSTPAPTAVASPPATLAPTEEPSPTAPGATPTQTPHVHGEDTPSEQEEGRGCDQAEQAGALGWMALAAGGVLVTRRRR